MALADTLAARMTKDSTDNDNRRAARDTYGVHGEKQAATAPPKSGDGFATLAQDARALACAVLTRKHKEYVAALTRFCVGPDGIQHVVPRRLALAFDTAGWAQLKRDGAALLGVTDATFEAAATCEDEGELMSLLIRMGQHQGVLTPAVLTVVLASHATSVRAMALLVAKFTADIGEGEAAVIRISPDAESTLHFVDHFIKSRPPDQQAHLTMLLAKLNIARDARGLAPLRQLLTRWGDVLSLNHVRDLAYPTPDQLASAYVRTASSPPASPAPARAAAAAAAKVAVVAGVKIAGEGGNPPAAAPAAAAPTAATAAARPARPPCAVTEAMRRGEGHCPGKHNREARTAWCMARNACFGCAETGHRKQDCPHNAPPQSQVVAGLRLTMSEDAERRNRENGDLVEEVTREARVAALASNTEGAPLGNDLPQTDADCIVITANGEPVHKLQPVFFDVGSDLNWMHLSLLRSILGLSNATQLQLRPAPPGLILTFDGSATRLTTVGVTDILVGVLYSTEQPGSPSVVFEQAQNISVHVLAGDCGDTNRMTVGRGALGKNQPLTGMLISMLSCVTFTNLAPASSAISPPPFTTEPTASGEFADAESSTMLFDAPGDHAADIDWDKHEAWRRAAALTVAAATTPTPAAAAPPQRLTQASLAALPSVARCRNSLSEAQFARLVAGLFREQPTDFHGGIAGGNYDLPQIMHEQAPLPRASTELRRRL
jgi:hypothetical protein